MENSFKRTIAEDVVQYSIFSTSAKSNHQSCLETLDNYLKKCLLLVFNETSNYIWQNESFNLRLVQNSSLPYLSGSTNFEDCIDDEWLIVYLLQQITATFPELIATVQDTDGQFLLIEAAEHIPKWLTPDTSENRVFISHGKMHILLKPSTPGNIAYYPVTNPTIEQALQIIDSFHSETVASSQCLACIDDRTKQFSLSNSENSHYANVFIPKELVFILDQYPNFISKCVHAFYLRDPIDLKKCRTFKHMLPENRVWTQIPMTRCQYAQLIQQNFLPDKRSGYQLSNSLTPAEEKGYSLGLKIAHGCEIFCSQSICEPKSSNMCKVFEGQSFLSFVEALTNYGYFQNEIEGSKLYQELFIKAKQYYLKASAECNQNQQETPFNIEISQLLQSLKVDSILPDLVKLKMKNSTKDLPSESCDKWMYLNEDDIKEIDHRFQKGFSSLQNSKKPTDDNELYTAETDHQLKDTVKKVNDFVHELSDYSGVEVDNLSPINFDTKQFVTSLEKILNVGYCKNDKSYSSDEESEDFLSDETSSVDEHDNEKFQEYMNLLDSELADTTISQSFVKSSDLLDANFNVNDDYSHNNVDVDANLLQNFMSGINENQTSGPINSILSTVNADLPSNIK